jgi:2-C-methyl-D-erythritol 4-phosphate cytidylyltransferase/2-C-methyl-D-erythritol 2,4-cyclodiphosphate synthase
MPRCVALVVAAGRGHRFGGDVPKQYRALAGRPVVRHALAALTAHPQIDAVRPVYHPDDAALFAAAADGLTVMDPVNGGATRQESVLFGLESLDGAAPEMVLIHDAARPFVDAAMVSRTLTALEGAPGAVPAMPVRDTLKRAEAGHVVETVDRQGLWRAQTPQGFRFAEILAAHRRLAGEQLTDDAAVAERAGLAVAVVDGSEDNLKITTEDDLKRAERMIGGGGTVRTGFGFDVHRFGPGDGVRLCGVTVPFDQALAGHSDADVALHALTDALLGAIGAGDIGDHFPPTDDRWRGAASDIFLRHAAALVAAAGGVINNVDLTIVCERPRIGPHRTAMVDSLADILRLSADRIGVKATTTEGLGFTGRQEGIAAQAVATVHLLDR